LGQELQRFLADEPVQARPPSVTYRAKKFLRRNKELVIACSLVFLALVAGIIGTGIGLIQAEHAREAEAKQRQLAKTNEAKALLQAEQLRTAVPEVVPALLYVLNEDRAAVLPRLREVWDDAGIRRRDRVRAGLFLVNDHSEMRAQLAKWMLDIDDPREVLMVCHQLPQSDDRLTGWLWAQVDEVHASLNKPPRLSQQEFHQWQQEQDNRRFRALAALARFDPGNPRWNDEANETVTYLLKANPLHRELWQPALAMVRDHLKPALADAFRHPSQANHGIVSAVLLTAYFGDRPDIMADLACDADSEQFRVLYPFLKVRGAPVAETLEAELHKKAAANESERDRIMRAKRQANAAAALVVLRQRADAAPSWGQDPFEQVGSLLYNSPAPDARSYLIHALGPRRADPRLLISWLKHEKVKSIRAALVLALGEFSSEQMSIVDNNALSALISELLESYRVDPDPGLHSAIDWLLRHGKDGPDSRPKDWGERQRLEAIDMELAGRRRADGQRWYVSPEGQTFVCISKPEIAFLMGSTTETDPERSDDEPRHHRIIDRSFAIAAQPVTVEQWSQFVVAMRKRNIEIRSGDIKMYAPDSHCPIIDVSWYEAAMFCRWLSELEKVEETQMIYPSVEEIWSRVEAKEAKPLALYDLSRTGYRLPTEAEWEYACRGETTTSWHFGGAVELLPRHGWFWTKSDSRSWPVGEKMPNELGLFDMHGNVWNWCHDPYRPYPKKADAVHHEEPAVVGSLSTHVLRGGSFRYKPVLVRSACRLVKAPTFRESSVGLRVARTMGAEPLQRVRARSR
jgi:formylglycine-generating enzyme required for sulfatase activity